MEEFLEIYKSSNHEIVYVYQFETGGLADFIKFAIKVINFCYVQRIKFYVFINHPLAEFIQFKFQFMNFANRFPNPHFEIQSYNRLRLIKNAELTLSAKMQILPDYCYTEDWPIALPSGIRFQDIMDFKQVIYASIPTLPPNYVAVHLRLGDLHMDCAKGFTGPTRDSRQWDESRLCSLLEELHSQGKDIVFLSDNRNYKKKLMDKYPYLHMTDMKIGHIGLQYVTSDDILNTIFEFVLIMKSSHIYAASYSGFNEIASMISGIPITKLYNTTN